MKGWSWLAGMSSVSCGWGFHRTGEIAGFRRARTEELSEDPVRAIAPPGVGCCGDGGTVDLAFPAAVAGHRPPNHLREKLFGDRW